MKCRSCSAEIDAKAIVCYRCGAPTAAPAPHRPEMAARRGPWLWVAAVVVLVLAVAAYLWLAGRTSGL